jgi:hypothetical protein
MKIRVGCVAVGFMCLVLSLSAQTFTPRHNFEGTDGMLTGNVNFVVTP